MENGKFYTLFLQHQDGCGCSVKERNAIIFVQLNTYCEHIWTQHLFICFGFYQFQQVLLSDLLQRKVQVSASWFQAAQTRLFIIYANYMRNSWKGAFDWQIWIKILKSGSSDFQSNAKFVSDFKIQNSCQYGFELVRSATKSVFRFCVWWSNPYP